MFSATAKFEPQILAAISRHVALFPPSRPDESYPPQLHKPSLTSQGSSVNRSPAVYHRSLTTSPKLSSERTKTLPILNGDVTPKINTKGAIFGKCNKRSPDKLQRYQTMRYALNPVDFVPRNASNTALHPARLPCSNETLASLSTFCFPGNSRLGFNT